MVTGGGFASGFANLGEIEAFKVSSFEFIWSSNAMQDKKNPVVFYKPDEIPRGFHILGHYCQPSSKPFRGFVLVARDVETADCDDHDKLPPLKNPLDFELVWGSNLGKNEISDGCGYFWIPEPPEGYKAVGYLVTDNPEKPQLDEICCVRSDLTEKCEPYRLILAVNSKIPELSFQLWSLRPCDRSVQGQGVPVGSFFCSNGCWNIGEELPIACLRNLNHVQQSMPNLQQIHALIEHYGPTIFFHPEELYLPSSVDWFFNNGALLYKKDETTGEAIEETGSNLPLGGTNDKEFWIDLPSDDRRDLIKRGDLQSARLYVHVKPALGGTFTDIAMWIFCPFNGPATVKIGITNMPLSRIGEHVGSSKLGLGIRNDACQSDLYVNSSLHYEIVAAEYLGDVVKEPPWLQFMREWGPKVVYDSRAEIDRIINSLPRMLQFSVKNFFNKLPVELYGEEGPTGPKEKNNWTGDERW
ncbi:hypothetical protein PIB30_029859 [Stylosanthes scabra]|uniref:Uncharacterized protein n=1 Tax=Stylosanthes scabra TaxID=79078 RepID=A0ABU6Y8L5_9FABA|nr:hypothetical protein [Stylosanthes scabra]